MKSNNVQLDLLQEKDLELVLAWRSNELVYRHFKEQNAPLQWQSHYKWFLTRTNRQDWIISFSEENKWRRVGSINVSKLDTPIPEVGIFIGEITLMGKGVGSASLGLVLNWLKDNTYTQARAIIHKDNIASQKLFSKFNFALEKKAAQTQFLSYLVNLEN